ncbi:MAG: hypothetical protein WBV96_24540, partial [Polyangia bacterium]
MKFPPTPVLALLALGGACALAPPASHSGQGGDTDPITQSSAASGGAGSSSGSTSATSASGGATAHGGSTVTGGTSA